MMIASCFIFSARAVLTVDEVTALTQLWNRFPDLREVPVWATTSDDGQYFGASWTLDFDNACASAGYNFYGIHCSSAGHVDGLNITDLWGFPTASAPITALSGLSFVRNITNTANRIGDSVVEGIIGSVPVEHVNWPAATFDPFKFSNPESIVSLNVFYASAVSLTSLDSLKSLTLTSASTVNDYFDVWDTIEEIVLLAYVNPMHVLDYLYTMPNLKVFRCPRCDAEFVPVNYTLSSSSLVELDLGLYSTGAPSSAPNIFSIQCAALRRLIIRVPSGEVSVSGAPNLISFTTSSPVYGTHMLTQLQSYNASISGKPPSISNGVLRSVILQEFSFNPTELTNFLCSVATSPVLQRLTLKISNDPGTIYDFPECLATLPFLERVELVGLKFDTESFLTNIPASVTTLKLVKALETQLRPDQVTTRFADRLKHFYADGVLIGRLAPTFFQDMPNLETIDIISDRDEIQGNIPWKGWENLKSVRLTGSFSAWSAIVGKATKLEDLYIKAPELITFPSDELFAEANLTSLRTFELDCAGLSGRIPEFWANLPQLTTVIIGGRFSGALPSMIGAPRLQICLFLVSHEICGHLPQFTVPTYLKDYQLSSARKNFFGPFPGTNLNILRSLSLRGAYLTGTIPHQFFNHHAVQREEIRLLDVNVGGNMWDMSRGTNLRGLGITGSRINICSSLDTPPGSIGSCSFDHVAYCPNSCSSAWSLCGYTSPCNATAPPPMTSFSCVHPPPRETPPEFAPPPPLSDFPSSATKQDFPIFLTIALGFSFAFFVIF